MKVKKALYIILMLLPLVLTLAALRILPDQIPAHYGFDGQVTRWGSKYETLVFPALTASVGLIMLLMAKVSGKQEAQGENNYKVCITAGLASMALFDVMTVYFLYTDLKQIENLNQVPVNMDSLMWGILGLTLMVLGNLMPKAKRNSLLGLRTVWSMSSEEAWKKCQSFGGIAAIVGGVAMVAVSFLTRGMLCAALCLVILIAMTVLDIVYSYHAAKN